MKNVMHNRHYIGNAGFDVAAGRQFTARPIAMIGDGASQLLIEARFSGRCHGDFSDFGEGAAIRRQQPCG